MQWLIINSVFVTRQSIFRALMGLMVGMAVCIGAQAAIDVHEFSNDKNRARYEKFIDELRCPKCQNENLAGSSSEIARDLRRELHRLIEAGESDQSIVDFMVSRYGDYVLYRPRLKSNTVVLWFGPLLLLGFGLLLAFRFASQRRLSADTSTDMSADEQAALEQMLAQNTSENAEPSESNKAAEAK